MNLYTLATEADHLTRHEGSLITQMQVTGTEGLKHMAGETVF